MGGGAALGSLTWGICAPSQATIERYPSAVLRPSYMVGKRKAELGQSSLESRVSARGGEPTPEQGRGVGSGSGAQARSAAFFY